MTTEISNEVRAKAKKLLVRSRMITISGLLFGAIESVFFYYRDGRHFFALTHEQTACDAIAILVAAFGLGLRFAYRWLFEAGIAVEKETVK